MIANTIKKKIPYSKLLADKRTSGMKGRHSKISEKHEEANILKKKLQMDRMTIKHFLRNKASSKRY